MAKFLFFPEALKLGIISYFIRDVSDLLLGKSFRTRYREHTQRSKANKISVITSITTPGRLFLIGIPPILVELRRHRCWKKITVGSE